MKPVPDVSQPIVLYVDDNGDDLFLAELVARRTHPPFTLDLAVGTEGIIEYFARDSEQLPAMVIVDYMLAHSCAPDLIRWLRDESAWAHIPVVVLSGRDDPACVAHCYASGANGFLVKALGAEGLQKIMTAIAECVTAEPVTVEPLRALESFRAFRVLELREALELQGQINVGLRERL